MMLEFLMLKTVMIAVMMLESGRANRIAGLIPPNMELFCPGKDICRRNSDILTIPPEIAEQYLQCCTNCSCDEDCGKSMPCCFPFPSNTQSHARRRQECVAVRGLGRSFYMVVKSLKDEEIITVAASNGLPVMDEPICGAIVNGPWGSTAPVYSSATGLIYKNLICAQQDSAEDIIPWDMFIECDWIMLKENNSNSISQYFAVFNLVNQTSCFTTFIPPPAIALDLPSEICYNDIVRSCGSGGFSMSMVYQTSNMTEQEIKDACESRFYSPVRINHLSPVYLNIFCYICNGNYYFEGGMVCQDPASRSGDMGSISSLAVLVSHKFIKNIQNGREITPESSETLVCDSEIGSIDGCKRVHCPAGQTYDHEGKCQFVLSEMPPLPLKIQLELKPVVEIHMSDLMTSSQNTNWLRSPWCGKWQIGLILASAPSQIGYKRPLSLYVDLITYDTKLSVEQLVSEIAYTLTKPFIICMNNGTCIEATQKFARNNRFVFSHGFMAMAEWYDIMQREDVLGSYPIQEVDINKYHVIFSDQGYLQQVAIDIKKHVLCHQVTLKEDEYVFIKNASVIFFRKQRRLLFLLEFELILDTNNKEEVRICLEDSKLPESSGSECNATYRVFFALFTSWLFYILK